MNSILQCLAHSEKLRDYFLSGEFRHDLNTDNTLGTRGELACEFASLLNEMWTTSGVPSATETVCPLSFKSTLEKHAKQFAGDDQHDAQELAIHLLDLLHEDTNRVREKPHLEKHEQGPHESDAEASETAWVVHRKMSNSRIHDQFMGQIRSRVECLVNGNTSTYDPSMYLSVPIPESNDSTGAKVTLMDCIRKYSEQEWLGDIRASKVLHINRAPNILIIHLKRFQFSATTNRKIDTLVHFPLVGLDLRDHVTHREGNGVVPVYDCYAVSNHSGTLDRGHCTAKVKGDDGTWLEYSDATVTKIDEKDVVGPEAYCLFLKRRPAHRNAGSVMNNILFLSVGQVRETTHEQLGQRETARSNGLAVPPGRQVHRNARDVKNNLLFLSVGRRDGGVDSESASFGDGGSSGPSESESSSSDESEDSSTESSDDSDYGFSEEDDGDFIKGHYESESSSEEDNARRYDDPGSDGSCSSASTTSAERLRDRRVEVLLDSGAASMVPRERKRRGGAKQQKRSVKRLGEGRVRKQAKQNRKDDPFNERKKGGKGTTKFSVDVRIDGDGEFDMGGDGEWRRVCEVFGVQDATKMLGTGRENFCNMAKGDEVLLPLKEVGTANDISVKIIKVTAVETDVRQEHSDDGNLHKPSSKDKRLLNEAKEALRSLTCPEYKCVNTDLDGCYLGKYPSLRQFRHENNVVVTRGQLDPYETFKTISGSTISEEKCAWTSGNRRCVYTRNSELGQGYVEFWRKDIHGEWSDIEVGDQNLAHESIPEETIEAWKGMTKRKKGGQSQGGVYALDQERNVIKYESCWKDFGYSSGKKAINVGELKSFGRKGMEIEGRTYVHASQCNGEKYDVGDTLLS